MIEDLYHIGGGRVGNKFLRILVDARGRSVTLEHIVNVVYATDPNGGPLFARESVRAAIKRVRKNLEGTGWEVPLTDCHQAIYQLRPAED